MIKSNFIILFLLVLVFTNAQLHAQSIEDVNFKKAELQLNGMIETIGDTAKNPGYTDKEGKLKLVPSSNWVSGFFPGCLWFMYEFSKENKWKIAAERFTKNEEEEQYQRQFS